MAYQKKVWIPGEGIPPQELTKWATNLVYLDRDLKAHVQLSTGHPIYNYTYTGVMAAATKQITSIQRKPAALATSTRTFARAANSLMSSTTEGASSITVNTRNANLLPTRITTKGGKYYAKAL